MDQQPPRRTSGAAAWLTGLLLAGSAVGVMFWQLSQKQKPLAFTPGLDSVAPQDRSQPAPYPAAAPQSGLDMVKPGAAPQAPARVLGVPALPAKENARPEAAARQGEPQSAAPAFTDAVRRSEAKARALAIGYTKRYPVILHYGQDWMSKPDLKKLNDDYMADHDPVKFLRGLAGSPSFPELTAKYARDPAVQAFAKEALQQAPRELLSASSDLLVEDGGLRALLSDAGQALGLPSSLTNGLKDYGKTPAQTGQAQPAQ